MTSLDFSSVSSPLLRTNVSMLSMAKHQTADISGLPPRAAAYVLTGYGMVAAMCEEVQNPEREVPKAIVLSVVAAGLTGLVLIVPLLFVMPDIATLLKEAQPIGLLFKTVTGSAAGGFGLLFLILGIFFFAGTGSLTAASRCTYAFARDGALPGHRLWARVDRTYGLPLWALALSTVVICLLGCIYFGSTAAFNSFTGVATICLSMSYCVPVAVLLFRRREAVRHSPFSLGRFGTLVNLVCVVWIVFAVVIFCMPVSLPVDAASMNYASVVFAGFAAVAVAWYVVYARHNFHGPPVLTRSDSGPDLDHAAAAAAVGSGRRAGGHDIEAENTSAIDVATERKA